jgi:hypothetical protein
MVNKVSARFDSKFPPPRLRPLIVQKRSHILKGASQAPADVLPTNESLNNKELLSKRKEVTLSNFVD